MHIRGQPDDLTKEMLISHWFRTIENTMKLGTYSLLSTDALQKMFRMDSTSAKNIS